MQVTSSTRGKIVVLSIQGPFVEEDLAKLDFELDKARGSGVSKVVLELREAPFIDSRGLEKIQSIAFDLARAGGDLRLAHLNDVCRDIFRTTRLESFVQIYDDRESALRSLA